MIRTTLILCSALVSYLKASESLFGNGVWVREHYIEDSGQRTFVDVDLDLTEGFITKFALYVHPDLRNSTNQHTLLMQIWRPVQPANVNAKVGPKFKLLYEKSVDIVPKQLTKLSLEVPLSAEEHAESYILSTDKLGFTGLTSVLPIAFDYVESRRVHLRTMDDGQPAEGSTYEFQGLAYPAIFSIGVYVTKDAPNTIGDQLIFGNPIVKSYEQTLPGQRVWVDDMINIAANGTLTMWGFYASHFTDIPALRLQIWSTTGIAHHYRLKWQKVVTLTSGGDRPYKFHIPEAQAPYVTTADRVGWTFIGDTGPISVKFDTSYATSYLPISDTKSLPNTGDQCEFVDLPMPNRFAVQIAVLQGPPPDVVYSTTHHTPPTQGTSTATHIQGCVILLSMLQFMHS